MGKRIVQGAPIGKVRNHQPKWVGTSDVRIGQRIWDLETPALFTGGVDGGNIRGGARAYSCLLASPPPHVVRGDPAAAAADVTSIAPVAETTA